MDLYYDFSKYVVIKNIVKNMGMLGKYKLMLRIRNALIFSTNSNANNA